MHKLHAVAAAIAVWTLVAQGSETTLALVEGRIYPSPDAAPIDDGVVIVVGATIAAVGPPDGIPYYLKEAVPADVLKLLPQPSTPREAHEHRATQHRRRRRHHQAVHRFECVACAGASNAGRCGRGSGRC